VHTPGSADTSRLRMKSAKQTGSGKSAEYCVECPPGGDYGRLIWLTNRFT